MEMAKPQFQKHPKLQTQKACRFLMRVSRIEKGIESLEYS